jgi:uncharacterized protein
LGFPTDPASGELAVTVRLRGHHLLCLLTYVGKGYTPAFVANLDRVAERLGTGEAAMVVEGPDEICGPMLSTEDRHCLGVRVRERDASALASVSGLLGRTVAPGTVLALDPGTVGRLREGFASGVIRPACAGCEWSQTCTGIAAAGYPDVRLPPAGRS